MRTLLQRIWHLVRRSRHDADLLDEIETHRSLRQAQLERDGLSASEAARASRHAIGSVTLAREDARGVWIVPRLESFAQDLRFSARTLAKTPGFTLTAILSLGIGIAGTATVFSIADAYLIRVRPGVADPVRLVEFARTGDGDGEGFDTFSYPDFVDIRARQTRFHAVTAYDAGNVFGLSTDLGPVRVSGAFVAANFFDVVGVPMLHGRGFLAEEENGSSPRTVAIISSQLWRTQFNASPDIVGRPIPVNGRPFTIVGVAGQKFQGYSLESEHLWVPLTAYPRGEDLTMFGARGRQWLMGLGRLKPDASLEQARAEMERIGADLEREHPAENRGLGLVVGPSGTVPVDLRPLVGWFMTLLFALVGLILLIASINVSGMLLARGINREAELTVRLALGAERSRIVRLLLIESLVVTALSTVIGLAGAWSATRFFESIIPALPLDITMEIAIDWRVVAFASLVAALTCLTCGWLPARAASRVDLAAALGRDKSRRPGRLRLRQALVVAQAALCVPIAVCALLLGRSMQNVYRVDPGFDVEGIEVVDFNLHLAGYDTPRGRAFFEALMSRVRSMPGLESAALARVVPLSGEAEGGRFWLPDRFGDEKAIVVNRNYVTPEFFQMARMPIVAGRNFDDRDRPRTPGVIIINETFARRAWPGQNAVGQRLVLGVSRWPVEVIGVTRDAKYRRIGEVQSPFAYHSAWQASYEPTMRLLMRPTNASLVPAVRAIVRDLDSNLPIVRAASLSDLAAFTLFPQRVAAWLAAIVGVIGVFLAALGVYGLTSYSVSQRRREIGIRLALGAVRHQVLGTVVSRALMLTTVGTALGLVAAALVMGLLEGMLYDVRPLDAVSFTGGAAVCLVCALVASLVPARRAVSVDPAETLRSE
jgi:predicted permease